MGNRCVGNVEIPPNGVCPHCGSGPNDRCGKFEYLSRAQMDARLAEAQAHTRPVRKDRA